MAFFNDNLRNLPDVNVNLQDGRNLRQQELNEAELRWNLRLEEEEREDEEDGREEEGKINRGKMKLSEGSVKLICC